MGVKPKVDVVTIGAGYTAAILAMRLTAKGMQVVSLEQGPRRWANPDFEMDHDPLRYDNRHMMMVNLHKLSWTWRPNPKAPALPMRQYGSFHPGQGLGGAAIHWSGMLWRFLETDFKYRSHHVQRYGASKIPSGCTVQDWPISYKDLEPYYDRFEYEIGAGGIAGNLRGKIHPGGNPFEAPRSRPFPNPPLTSTIHGEMFAKACRELGYHPFPQPTGILSRAWKDPFGNFRSGCVYCGYCTRFGCEVDAKSSPQTTYLPISLATGRHEIRMNCHVTRINLDKNGRATGVTYIDEHGKEQVQPADLVLLTAYTLGNVRTMFLSRGLKQPNGIGNNRSRLGKNMTYQHWQSPVSVTFKGRKFNQFMANTSTVNLIYDFNADNFDHSKLDFIGGASIFAGDGERHPVSVLEQAPAGTNAENPTGTSKSGKPTWGPEFKKTLKDWDSTASITMQGESLPYVDQFYDLDPTYKDAYGQPLLRITFDWHTNDNNMYRFIAKKAKEIGQQMGPDSMYVAAEETPYVIWNYQSTHQTGGAIMGSDPSNSVTNRYGQVWDTPNVFVFGAALYPQNPGANPTGTIGALCHWQADAIINSYLKHPDRLIT